MSDDKQLSMKLTGRVVRVMPWQEFASGFRKRSLIVEIADGNYPQEIDVEFAKDRGEKLDGAKPGMIAEIEADLRGRRWDPPNGDPAKWFVSVNGWRVTFTGEGTGDDEEHDPGAFTAPDDDVIPF